MTERGRAQWAQWARWGCRLGVAIGLWGCGSTPGAAEGPADAGADAAGNARVVLDEARRELVKRPGLRQGMQIDRDALLGVLKELRAQHGAQVAVAYDASLEALPQGEPPGGRFTEVASFSLPDDPATRDVEAINWLFDADVEQTVRRVLSTYLALMMMKDAEMSTEEVGVWMAFVRAAEPELRRCGPQGPGRRLCLDYGNDVFVLDMERKDPAWVVTRVRWMQAQHG